MCGSGQKDDCGMRRGAGRFENEGGGGYEKGLGISDTAMNGMGPVFVRRMWPLAGKESLLGEFSAEAVVRFLAWGGRYNTQSYNTHTPIHIYSCSNISLLSI